MLSELQNFFEESSMMMRLVMSFSLVLLAPRLFQKIKLPGVLALILVGVLFGPRGFHLFKENGQMLIVFALLGKLLLLFFSGLDIDLEILKKNLKKCLLLAAYSFFLPGMAGILIGLIFGYPLLSCFMIGILFSSQSIIAYPILSNLGLAKHESVMVTVGATAITDIVSLILLAICLPIHSEGFSVGPFFLQLVYIIIFIPGIIYGFKWLGKTIFKHLGEDPAEQMIFLLLVIGSSASVAELVNIDPIVGAFLAGLAVSTTLPNTSVRVTLDILGNTFFIPAFFISLGILIDPLVVWQTIRDHFLLVFLIVVGVILTKMLAAWLAGKNFHLPKNERFFVGSLIAPQVSSTLAVALVAFESINASGVRLIDESLFNSVLVLMVVSAIVGTLATEITGRKLVAVQPTNTIQKA